MITVLKYNFLRLKTHNPNLDNLALSENELERSASVSRRVEFFPVGQSPGVMDRNGLSCLRRISVSGSNGFNINAHVDECSEK